MKVTVLNEAGYAEAMQGLALSYNVSPINMHKRALKLAPKNGGNNKFLESMMVWFECIGPRYFWSEFDTYRVGITKQSESTMHTLKKELVTQSRFVRNVPISLLTELNALIEMDVSIDTIKAILPEGWIQKRVVCTNYKTINTILEQRARHRLLEWQGFCSQLQAQLKYKEFLCSTCPSQ